MMGAGVSDFHDFHALSNISDWDMRVLEPVRCNSTKSTGRIPPLHTQVGLQRQHSLSMERKIYVCR